jgi:hypothetical protein
MRGYIYGYENMPENWKDVALKKMKKSKKINP